MARRLRLLPMVIGAAALLLFVRAGDLWERGTDGLISAAPALAQEEAPAPAGANDEEPATPETDAATAGPPTITGDIIELTDSELALLQQLAVRREALEARAREIDLREKVLAVAEQRLEERIKELEAIRATVAAHLKSYDEEETAKLKSLVKIYENMKPKYAARIFEQLDLAILLDVIEGMREQKSASVLAAMDPEQAKTVTAALAVRRQLPVPTEAAAD